MPVAAPGRTPPALPKPHPGLVIAYAYLWHDARRRAAEGAADSAAQRPAAIVLAVHDEGGERIVTAAPLAADPPEDPRDGFALPRATRERLGLDDTRGFVIVSELNRFVWPGADLRPVATRSASAFVYGVLPPRLFKRITAQLIGRWHARDPE
jgi:hypothetical protein